MEDMVLSALAVVGFIALLDVGMQKFKTSKKVYTIHLTYEDTFDTVNSVYSIIEIPVKATKTKKDFKVELHKILNGFNDSLSKNEKTYKEGTLRLESIVPL